MEYFNKTTWREAAHHDDWYLRIQADYRALLERAERHPDEAEAIKEAIRGFFEEMLANGEVALGGPDAQLDAQRQPIRQAVIHHSKRKPGYYTLERLNAVHMLNLYVPYYSNPSLPEEQYLKGRPISSNHYRDGKMVFYGYHWWVESDGTVTRLLPDEAIGWQAGNWEVNCQSIGICINDDLTHKAPSDAALEGVRRVLRGYDELEVVGHREVNPVTVCPGDQFLANWKKLLLGTS